ncbi:hypothetical protein [Nostoc sp.]|uniref:hypothetical protein n=1 Tax=Nostoc sp. TaxID=1180 RepID=UPI002FF94CA7
MEILYSSLYYQYLNFEVIATRVTQIVGVATSLTGNNYNSTLRNIYTLEREVNKDEVLKEFMKEISLRNRQVQPPNSQLCQ